MPTQQAEIMVLQASVKELKEQLDVVEDTLHTLIVWITASAVSPISSNDAIKLIQMLERAEVKK